MKGVSAIIVLFLVLILGISLASIMYGFVTSLTEDATEAGKGSAEKTTEMISSSFKIESIQDNTIYIRNMGNYNITNIAVYINGKKSNISVPSSIMPKKLEGIKVLGSMRAGDVLKVSSGSGLDIQESVSEPCDSSNVILCHKLDQSSGLISPDSSKSGFDGNLDNMEDLDWVSGIYGNALQFDGVNEEIEIPKRVVQNGEKGLTVSVWIRRTSASGLDFFVGQGRAFRLGVTGTGAVYSWIRGNNSGGVDTINTAQTSAGLITLDQWYFISSVWNGTEPSIRIFVDENLEADQPVSVVITNAVHNSLAIGNAYPNAGSYFAGYVDEVRLYNKAIY